MKGFLKVVNIGIVSDGHIFMIKIYACDASVYLWSHKRVFFTHFFSFSVYVSSLHNNAYMSQCFFLFFCIYLSFSLPSNHSFFFLQRKRKGNASMLLLRLTLKISYNYTLYSLIFKILNFLLLIASKTLLVQAKY